MIAALGWLLFTSVGDDDEPDVAVTVHEARGSGLAVAGVGQFPAEPVEVMPKL